MKNMRITTAELARIVGVSQGTVDRALNNRGGINAETKKKILAAAAHYGFRKQIGNEKSDRVGNSQIGVIVFNLNNRYFSSLIADIENECRKIGYSIVVMFTDYDPKTEIECIKRMYNIGVSGVVLFSVNSGADFVNFIKETGMPTVCVGNRVPGIRYVGIDDFAAMRTVTESVLDFSNILYFSPALNYESAYAQKRRFEGYSAAIESMGREVRAICREEDIAPHYDDTAIICSTDYYALKVYFKTSGAKIIGFDNIDILDDYKIPISSVAYSSKKIAHEAVKSIKESRTEDVIVDYSIIWR